MKTLATITALSFLLGTAAFAADPAPAKDTTVKSTTTKKSNKGQKKGAKKTTAPTKTEQK